MMDWKTIFDERELLTVRLLARKHYCEHVYMILFVAYYCSSSIINNDSVRTGRLYFVLIRVMPLMIYFEKSLLFERFWKK